jgi:hypothetical protein
VPARGPARNQQAAAVGFREESRFFREVDLLWERNERKRIVASGWFRRRPATGHAWSPGFVIDVAGWPVEALDKRATGPSVVMLRFEASSRYVMRYVKEVF